MVMNLWEQFRTLHFKDLLRLENETTLRVALNHVHRKMKYDTNVIGNGMKWEGIKTFQFNYYSTGEVGVHIQSFLKRI